MQIDAVLRKLMNAACGIHTESYIQNNKNYFQRKKRSSCANLKKAARRLKKCGEMKKNIKSKIKHFFGCVAVLGTGNVAQINNRDFEYHKQMSGATEVGSG